MSTDDDGHQGSLSQADKFKQAARALECDEDEARWNVRLKKVAKAPPAPHPKGG